MEVIARYSNRCDQGERILEVIKMVPERSSEAISRTKKQIQRRLSADHVDDLVAAFQGGAKVTELATAFGIHRDTVSQILNRAGIQRSAIKLNGPTVDRAIELYRAGNSLAKVAPLVGASPETVRKALLQACVDLRPRSGCK